MKKLLPLAIGVGGLTGCLMAAYYAHKLFSEVGTYWMFQVGLGVLALCNLFFMVANTREAR